MTRIDEAIRDKRHPLSLAHLSMIDADHVTLAKAAVAGGFDAVGMRILAPRHTKLAGEIIGNAGAIAEVKRIFADTGLALFDVESFSLLPETKVEDFKAGLELAAELGGAYVLTSSVDPDTARMIDNFCQLCEAAQAVGLRIGIEFISFRYVRTLADAVELLNKAAQPNAGIILDALHLSRTFGTPADIAKIDRRLIGYAQLSDAVAKVPTTEDELISEARVGRLLPGDGELWLPELLRALAPTLPIAVEAPVATLASLAPIARGKLIGDKMRAYLAKHASVDPTSSSLTR